MKLKCLIVLMGCNLLIACSGQNTQLANQPLDDYSSAEPTNTQVANEKTNNPTSCTNRAYQTDSKCLYVKINCPKNQKECEDVDLTIVEKATRKSQKIKGKIWHNRYNGAFGGFEFYDANGYYFLTLGQTDKFGYWDDKNNTTTFEENITSTPDFNSKGVSLY